MPVIVITPPSPIVTTAEAKLHCRIDDSDVVSDSLVEAYIAAATAWVDGPGGWLGRAIGVQELEWQLCEWPCEGFRLPYPPTIEVLSIKYIDPHGVEQDWDFPSPLNFENLPALRGRDGDLKIRYRAGYGSSSGDPAIWTNTVPAPIKVAILMLVGHWYENREAVSLGAAPTSAPLGFEALLSTFRVWSY